MQGGHDVSAGMRTPRMDDQNCALTIQEAKLCALFHHQTLDLNQHEIRLIDIHPDLSPVVGRIQCRLWHANPDCDYKALSYTWGSSERYRVIDINHKGFAVRENLWQFLNAARLQRLRCSLWIDAISIDQDNVVERSHQVQYMGHIYSGANQVIVWLGLATEGTNALARHLLRNQQQQRLETHPETRCLRGIQSSQSLIAAGTRDLCQRDYWLRAWIIQEVLLAKELVIFIGTELIAWHHVSNFVLLGDGRPASQLWHECPSSDFATSLDTTHAYRLLRQRMDSAGTMHSHTLDSLVRQFADSRCKDIRDRIFGLLGLVERGMEFSVDYRMPKFALFSYTLEFCGRATDVATARKLASLLELTGPDIINEVIPDHQDIITRTVLIDTQRHVICYHCNQIIILPNDAENLWPSHGVEIEMCCLKDADMEEHLFFSDPVQYDHVQLDSIGLPAASRHKEGQLQAMKKFFSTLLLFKMPKAVYLRISKKHYVYLLSDELSRARLLNGYGPPETRKDDTLENFGREEDLTDSEDLGQGGLPIQNIVKAISEGLGRQKQA